MITARKWVVSGRVQGVGFRNYIQRQARKLGLTGYVRNLANGNVEVAADGPGEALETLRGYVERGPMLAEVRGCSEEPAEPLRYDSFDIR